MPTKGNVIILSRPVRTGKTTELLTFVTGRQNVGGFLTPDVNGRRLLYEIASQTYHPFEVDEDSTEPFAAVGKFRFSLFAFNKAKRLFSQRVPSGLFIVDEVGKLELHRNSGFEPELTEWISRYAAGEGDGSLLLVVRDSLLDKALDKYGLMNALVIDSLEQLPLGW